MTQTTAPRHDTDAHPDADTHGGAGLHTSFRGPYADGPPPEALLIDAPELDRFGLAEIRRMFVVAAVLTSSILRGLLTKLTRPRSGSWLACASSGMVDGFFRLGPTYVKVGQIIASSPGLFPDDMSRPAQRCLQEVPPFPTEIVHRVIREDLGRSPHALFARFDDTPLSAASVGQVHACVLPDGREAVVKLQRPDIGGPMNTDLRIVFALAKLLMKTDVGRRANATGQVRDLWRVTNQELNCALEAHRQDQFRRNIHHYGDNEWVTAPEVYWDYCGPRVICMERLRGVPMDDFEALAAKEVDARSNLRRGMKTWVEALAVHGPFHGDLHAGNIWSLDDGRNCFLDFGIMGELDDDWRQMMRDILYTFIIDHDFTRIVAGYKRLGVLDPDIGTDEELAALMAQVFEPIMKTEMKDLKFAELFQQSLDMAEQFGDISSPEELTLLGKQFLYFERYVKGIAPDYLMVKDPYLLKNIFPVEAARKMRELQAAEPDLLVDPDDPTGESWAADDRSEQAAPAVPSPAGGIELPDVDHDGPTYVFGSDEWFAAVERLEGEAPPLPDELAGLVVNARVTGGPDGDADVHLRAGRPGRGHTDEARAVVTVPYDVARALIVSMDPAPAMQAMVTGAITVDGELDELMKVQAQLTAPNDDQLLFAARVRALTAPD